MPSSVDETGSPPWPAIASSLRPVPHAGVILVTLWPVLTVSEFLVSLAVSGDPRLVPVRVAGTVAVVLVPVLAMTLEAGGALLPGP